MSEADKKLIILRVWCDRYAPATPERINMMKTTEEIMIDLRPMADFSVNEIANYLTDNGYTPGYNGDEQVWMLIDTKEN